MNRFVFTCAGRNLPKAVCLRGIAAQNFCPALGLPVCLLESRKAYSTKASELKKIVPEFWIMKMKTSFVWADVNGNGYVTEQDYARWIKEMTKLFPVMTKEQNKILKAKYERCGVTYTMGKGAEISPTVLTFIS